MQVNIYKVGPNMQPRLQLGDQTSGRACSSVAQLWWYHWDLVSPPQPPLSPGAAYCITYNFGGQAAGASGSSGRQQRKAGVGGTYQIGELLNMENSTPVHLKCTPDAPESRHPPCLSPYLRGETHSAAGVTYDAISVLHPAPQSARCRICQWKGAVLELPRF